MKFEFLGHLIGLFILISLISFRFSTVVSAQTCFAGTSGSTWSAREYFCKEYSDPVTGKYCVYTSSNKTGGGVCKANCTSTVSFCSNKDSGTVNCTYVATLGGCVQSGTCGYEQCPGGPIPTTAPASCPSQCGTQAYCGGQFCGRDGNNNACYGWTTCPSGEPTATPFPTGAPIPTTGPTGLGCGASCSTGSQCQSGQCGANNKCACGPSSCPGNFSNTKNDCSGVSFGWTKGIPVPYYNLAIKDVADGYRVVWEQQVNPDTPPVIGASYFVNGREYEASLDGSADPPPPDCSASNEIRKITFRYSCAPTVAPTAVPTVAPTQYSCSRCSDSQRNRRVSWTEYDSVCDLNNIAVAPRYTPDPACCVDDTDCKSGEYCNVTASALDPLNYHVCKPRPTSAVPTITPLPVCGVPYYFCGKSTNGRAAQYTKCDGSWTFGGSVPCGNCTTTSNFACNPQTDPSQCAGRQIQPWNGWCNIAPTAVPTAVPACFPKI